MHLVYFADPLCSWCYGFGPELSELLDRRPDIRLELVMGGLRPFNREPMSEAFRRMLLEHWKHVAEASGLPFSTRALEGDGFVYDTEPPSRAVVTARGLNEPRALAYLKAVHTAFYRDGRDATRSQVLADIALDCGYDREAFAAALESEPMRAETRRDFARAQAMGVAGFPTLGVARGEQVYLVASGFTRAEVLLERIAEIERRTGTPRADAA